MTVLDKVKQIVKNGMIEKEVFKYFDTMDIHHKQVIDHITIFGYCGIDQDTVWDLYQVWQCE